VLELNVHWAGFQGIDFDRKKIRHSLRQAGREVQRSARRLIAHKAISAAGDYPGKQSGQLQRAIKSKVSKYGFLVRVAPQKTATMTAFYPAFLHYGIRNKAGHRGQQSKSGSWRIAPRANFMQDALNERRHRIRELLREALQRALVPRK
jgi:hypothetical protein